MRLLVTSITSTRREDEWVCSGCGHIETLTYKLTPPAILSVSPDQWKLNSSGSAPAG